VLPSDQHKRAHIPHHVTIQPQTLIRRVGAEASLCSTLQTTPTQCNQQGGKGKNCSRLFNVAMEGREEEVTRLGLGDRIVRLDKDREVSMRLMPQCCPDNAFFLEILPKAAMKTTSSSTKITHTKY
jgi:hypothetical protein